MQLEATAKHLILVADNKAAPLFRSLDLGKEPLFKTITGNKTADALRKFATAQQGRFLQPQKKPGDAIKSGQKLRLSQDAKVGWKLSQCVKKEMFAKGSILFKASGVLNTVTHARETVALSQEVIQEIPSGAPVATQCELVERQSAGWARMLDPMGFMPDHASVYLLLDCHDIGGVNRYV
jgi:hypothetical protein